MVKNVEPRKAAQELKEFVLRELDISDPSFNGYGNMVENVITVLKKHGKILWENLPAPNVIMLSPKEMRHAADQVEAYRKLHSAGAESPPDGSVITVYGRPIGFLMHGRHESLLEVALEPGLGGTLDWVSVEKRDERYPPWSLLVEDYSDE